jgi:hypothetical protein
MTPQVINRREGGLKSCCGRGPKLRAFTLKELETMKAVQKLLGAPTIGGGGPGQGVVVERVKVGK